MKKTYKELKKGDFIYVLVPSSANDLYYLACGYGIYKLIKKVPVVKNDLSTGGYITVKYSGQRFITEPFRAGTKDRDYRLRPFSKNPVDKLQPVFVNEEDARSLLQKFYKQVEIWTLEDLKKRYKECRERLDSLITKMGRKC